MFCRFTDHFHLEHPNWFETLKLEAICISLSGPPWKWKRWYLTWNILLELVELVGLSDYPYETLFRKSHSFSSQKRNASIIHPCLGSELYWRFIRCTKPRTLHTVMGSARRSNTCYPKTAQNIQKHPTTSHSMFNTTVGKNQDHEMHEAIFLTFEGWKSFNLLCKNQALSINFIFFTASLQGVRKLKDSISWNNSLWGGHCEGTDCANFLRSKFSRIPSQKIHMFSAIFSPRNSIRGWGATKSTKPDSASDVCGWNLIWRPTFGVNCDSHRSFRKKNIINSSGQHKNAPTSPPNRWLEDLVMGTRNIVLQCHFLCTSSQWGALRRISTGLKNEAQQFGIPQMGSQVNRVECLLQDFFRYLGSAECIRIHQRKLYLGFMLAFLDWKADGWSIQRLSLISSSYINIPGTLQGKWIFHFIS